MIDPTIYDQDAPDLDPDAPVDTTVGGDWPAGVPRSGTWGDQLAARRLGDREDFEATREGVSTPAPSSDPDAEPAPELAPAWAWLGGGY